MVMLLITITFVLTRDK